MRFAKLWQVVLGITLILWALMLLDILSLGDVVLGIGALISGILLMINR